MKTIEGWLRGRLCGKRDLPGGKFACALCGRFAGSAAELCYPARVQVS
jgi:hypothetical protein